MVICARGARTPEVIAIQSPTQKETRDAAISSRLIVAPHQSFTLTQNCRGGPDGATDPPR
jgi:hypothetical protein